MAREEAKVKQENEEEESESDGDVEFYAQVFGQETRDRDECNRRQHLKRPEFLNPSATNQHGLHPMENTNGCNSPLQLIDGNKSQTITQENTDVETTYSNASNANVVFPHARFHCGVHPFILVTSQQYSPSSNAPWTPTRKTHARTNAMHCHICHCYVCDTPAASCSQWSESHCFAHPSIEFWAKARKEQLRKRRIRSLEGGKEVNDIRDTQEQTKTKYTRKDSTPDVVHSHDQLIPNQCETNDNIVEDENEAQGAMRESVDICRSSYVHSQSCTGAKSSTYSTSDVPWRGFTARSNHMTQSDWRSLVDDDVQNFYGSNYRNGRKKQKTQI